MGRSTLVSVYEHERVRVWDGCPSTLHMSALCIYMCLSVRPCQLSVYFFGMSSDLLRRACSFSFSVHPTHSHLSLCCLLPHQMLSDRLNTEKQGYWLIFTTRWHTDGVRTGLKPLNSMLTGWRYVSTWNGSADHPSTHSETLAGFHHVYLYGNREKRQAVTLGSLALPFHSSYWVAMATAPSEVVWPFHFGSRHQCCLFHNKIITRHPGSLIPRISFKSFCSDERLARFSVRPEKN